MGDSAHWVQYKTGVWHLWVRGKSATPCGAVSVLDIAQNPFRAVSDQPPPPIDWDRAPACLICLRRYTEGVQQVEYDVGECAKQWVGLIKRRALRAYVKLKEEDIEDFADVLARLGPFGDNAARQVFEEIASVLLRPMGRRKWKASERTGNRVVAGTYSVVPKFSNAVASLHSDPAQLQHLASAIRTWRTVTKQSVAETGGFQADLVIQTILRIPDPATYIRHMVTDGVTALAAIFHPNTLARVKRNPKFSGALWNGQRGDASDILEGVNIVDG